MIVGLDFDGVLADPMQKLCQVVSTKYGHPMTTEDLTEWDCRRVLGIDLNQEGIWDEVFNDLNLPFVHTSVAGVRRLSALGHEMVVVTSRRKAAFGFVREYLERYYYQDLSKADIIQTGELDRNLHVMLDDDPIKLLRLRPKVTADLCLLERPWNRHCVNVAGRLVKVRHWGEFVGRLTT